MLSILFLISERWYPMFCISKSTCSSFLNVSKSLLFSTDTLFSFSSIFKTCEDRFCSSVSALFQFPLSADFRMFPLASCILKIRLRMGSILLGSPGRVLVICWSTVSLEAMFAPRFLTTLGWRIAAQFFSAAAFRLLVRFCTSFKAFLYSSVSLILRLPVNFSASLRTRI